MPNQGGTREQHEQAGHQSHKNDENRRRPDDQRQEQQEDGENRQQGGNFENDPERAREAGRKGGRE